MRIQNKSVLANQINVAKNTKSSDNSFGHVLESHIKNENPNEHDTAQPHPAANADPIDRVRQLTLSHGREVKLTGLKELVKDSFSDISPQILHDINSLCSDDTGEKIDIKLLDELLELYMESQS